VTENSRGLLSGTCLTVGFWDLRKTTRQVSPDSPYSGQNLDLGFPTKQQTQPPHRDFQSTINSIKHSCLADEGGLCHRLAVCPRLVSGQDIHTDWPPPPISWRDAGRSVSGVAQSVTFSSEKWYCSYLQRLPLTNFLTCELL